MPRIEIPAVPAEVVYKCDRCTADDIEPDTVLDVKDRDWQGGVVYGHKEYLCRACSNELALWVHDA